MERTFTNATLLSASVLTAFMILIPINHLSAQNEVKLMDEQVKVHKAVIEKVADQKLTVTIDDNELPVYMDASTTIFLGSGDEAGNSALKEKQNVYIFGSYDKGTHSILATKIVIRNKPVMDRSNLSQISPSVPSRYPDTKNNTLSLLGFSQ